MKKRIITLLAVLALLVTCAVFAVQASGDAQEQIPAATVVKLTGSELCPHCGETLAAITAVNGWSVATSTTTDWTAAHIWIKSDVTLNASPAWGTNAQTILIRSSTDFAAEAQPVKVSMTENGRFSKDQIATKLGIFGENATLEGKLVSGANGGMFSITGGSELTVYGNITLKAAEGAATASVGGMVFINKGTAKFTGVTFDGGKAANGGAIYQTNGGTSSTKSYLVKCNFYDCQATAEGGAGLFNTGIVDIDDCVFYNCSAGTNGGAIKTHAYEVPGYGYQFPSVTVDNSTVQKCHAAAKGGAFFNNSNGTVTLTKVTITGCDAYTLNDSTNKTSGTGGAIYNNKGTFFVLGDSKIEKCYAGSNGGAVFIETGRFELGGTSEIHAYKDAGYANAKGVRIQGGWMRVKDSAKIVSTGTGLGQGISAMTTSATAAEVYIILANNGSVVGPTDATKYQGNIQLAKWDGGGTSGWPANKWTYAHLYILAKNWNGDASVAYTTVTTSAYTTTVLEQKPGVTKIVETAGEDAVGNSFAMVAQYGTSWVPTTVTGKTFDGTLCAENEGNVDPKLYPVGSALMPMRAAVVDKNEKIVDWGIDGAAALGAASAWNENNSGHFVRLYSDTTIAQTGGAFTSYLDLNGHNVTSMKMPVNNELYVFDTAAAAGEAGGKVTLATDNAGILHGAYAYNGKAYFTETENSIATVYPVSMEITSVNLRPAADSASLYYTAEFVGLEHAPDGFTAGVAVTLENDAPNDDLGRYMYTAGANAKGEYHGVLLSGIIRQGLDNNAARAEAPIHARAYIKFGDTVVMSESVDWNLLTVVNKVAAIYDTLTESAQQTAFKNLCKLCSGITLTGENAWHSKVEELGNVQ